MASRRCLRAILLLRRPSLLSSPTATHALLCRPPHPSLISPSDPPPTSALRQLHCLRLFSSSTSDQNRDSNNEGEEDDDEYEDEDDDDDAEESEAPASSCVAERANATMDEEGEAAAAIGYEVIGHVDGSEDPFKPWEPVFAVIQIGSHQFKVSNGDTIYTERLKHCDINDKLILNRVLMLGSTTQTIIGRPILPNASVHAVVEEHALDAKVIIFKKKRRKKYRRTKGHRQELTRLRIADIQGIEKPQVEFAV